MFKGRLQFINPRHQVIWDADSTDLSRDELLAVYPAGGALSSQLIGKVVRNVLPLAPKLIEALKAQGAEEIIVICGGVIPQQDYDFLKSAGVKAIFGPGTNIPEAAEDILRLIGEARLGTAAE